MGSLGTVEIGGTKTLVAAGIHPDDLYDASRIETTTPEETLTAVAARLREVDIDAIGVAAFGPVELRHGHPDYGQITTTPKKGWQSADIVSFLSRELDVPVGFDTDVNGAALGEGRWGAARGLNQFVYVTVGTGIGGGAVIDGSPLHGWVHPELGHLIVQRHPDDDYSGRCPFHGDCLEGMVSGPAIEDRFGVSAPDLVESQLATALTLVTSYLAQGLRNITYALAPQRIIVGGGVAKLPGFFDCLRDALIEQLAGYPGLHEHGDVSFVSPPGLGDRAGLAGGLVLAELAVG